MRTLHTISTTAARYAAVARDFRMAMIGLVIGMCICESAVAQSIKFQGLTIEQTEKGFVVTGKVQGSDLNKGGIVESDQVAIVADIKENAGAQYQLLPVSLLMRDPAGAETSFTKGSGAGNTMTKLECYGKDIKQVGIASLALRNEPVWRAYGGLGEWTKKAPATVAQEFTGTIPLAYAGKTIRIRASLTHRVGGPYANWPGFGYCHDIGYSGILKGGIALIGNISAPAPPKVGNVPSPKIPDPDQLKVSGTFDRIYAEADPASKAVDFSKSIQEPWSDLFVMVTGPSGKQTRTKTDANGHFQIDVDKKGDYTIEVEDPHLFSRDEYIYRVSVPNGELDMQLLEDDMKMWSYSNVAASLKMLEGLGLFRGGDINGLKDALNLVNKLDWANVMNINGRRLVEAWDKKKWKYVTPGRRPGSTGVGLMKAVVSSIIDNAPGIPGPTSTATIRVHKRGDTEEFDGSGAYLLQHGQPGGKKIELPNGNQVRYSTVLYCRDDKGVDAYVIEGLVLAYANGIPMPIAGAITNSKIIQDINAAPRVEPFTWAEAITVWETGKRVASGGPGSNAGGKPGSSAGGVSLAPIADACVYAYAYLNWNKANLGAYKSLRAGWHPAGGEGRTYLKFDIPGNANSFTKATLRLFHNHTGGSNSLPLGVHAAIAPWKEGADTYHSGQAEKPAVNGEITWINQPAYNQVPVATFNLGTPDQYVDVDVTPLVMAWLTGKPNHGLVLAPIGTPGTRTPESSYGFYSREHADHSKRPVMILSSSSLPSQTPPGTGSTGSTGQVIPGSPPTTITQPIPHVPSPVMPAGPGHVGHQHSGNQPTGQNAKPVLLLSEDFSHGAGKWSVDGQPPTIRDGRAYFVAGNNRTLGTDLRLPIEDFAIEFDAYGDGEMLNVLIANEKLKLYAASIRRGTTMLIAHGPENIKEFPAVFEPGKWHHYRFVRFGDQMELFLDGKRVAYQIFARPLEGPALLGFGGLQSTIGVDNILFYDLSNIPRIGTAVTPRTPKILEPSQPAGVGGNVPTTHDPPSQQPRRRFQRFHSR